MPDKVRTELEKLEQEIRNKYKNSSPRLIAPQIAPQIEQAISEDMRTALNIGRIETTEETTEFMVVHYTSLSAVIAMLKDADALEDKGYLRMYSTSGFNDPNEGRHLADMAKENYSRLSSFLRKEKDTDYAFVASFIQNKQSDDIKTRNEDDLFFWRTYGREGTGCSLKLSLKSAAEEMRQVKYCHKTTDQSVELIEKKLSQILGTVDNIVKITKADRLSENYPLHPKKIANSQIKKELEKIRYLYKNPAYWYENECRLVETLETSKTEPKFDYSGPQGMEIVKKYIEHPLLKLTEEVLHSNTIITLGPRVPNRTDAKEYIESLLKKAGFGAKIEVSKIPYRTNTVPALT